MEKATRRIFMMQIAASGAVLAAANVLAQTPAPKLDEKDPLAVSLGYVADTTKVDKAKFPKHTVDQKCSGCQLYTGKPKEAMGPCTIFGGKQVAANGWCSAYVKKA